MLNPNLHEDLLKYFTGKNKFDAEQLEKYRRENNREDLTDKEVIEEILADNFGQIQKRARLMQEIASDDTSLIKRLVAFIKNLAEKFVSYFHNPEGGMTTAQRDAFLTGFNKLAASLKDAQGESLYKTSGGGKILKLSDGKELPKNDLIFRAKIGENTAEIEALRKKFQGTDKWLKAPNGKNTNLTEKQWLTVRTESFKRWFGDWENDKQNSSQVVDENGEPLVVYHGSNKKFNIFKYGDLGFHFGTQEQAEVAAEGQVEWNEKGKPNVIGTFLNIRNPIKIDYDPETWNDRGSRFIWKLEEEGIISHKDFERLPYIDGLSYKKMRPIREKIQQAGYDGVIYPNWYEFRTGEERRTTFDNSFIIFNPNQVKSATDNIGEFNPLDDDIRFSFAGEKAQTADKDSLKQAKKLERQGKNRDEIYQATGWFKGRDDKWRFEIPDNLDKIDFSLLKYYGEVKLEDIYDNPTLYQAYPKLAKVKVSLKETEKGTEGFVRAGAITLSARACW